MCDYSDHKSSQLTLKKIRKIKEVVAKTVSHSWISWVLWTISSHASMNVSALVGIPKKLLSWTEAISKDAAHVKPAITGNEKYSMTKPKLNNPRRKMIKPEMKVRRIATFGPYLVTCGSTMIAIMPVGPTFTSLQLPKTA